MIDIRKIVEKLVNRDFTQEEWMQIETIVENLKPDSIIHKDTLKLFLDKSFIDGGSSHD